MGHLWSTLRVDQQGPLCGLFKELSHLPEKVGRRLPHASHQLSDSPQPALLPFRGLGCPPLICPADHTLFKRVSLSPRPPWVPGCVFSAAGRGHALGRCPRAPGLTRFVMGPPSLAGGLIHTRVLPVRRQASLLAQGRSVRQWGWPLGVTGLALTWLLSGRPWTQGRGDTVHTGPAPGWGACRAGGSQGLQPPRVLAWRPGVGRAGGTAAWASGFQRSQCPAWPLPLRLVTLRPLGAVSWAWVPARGLSVCPTTYPRGAVGKINC